MDLTYTAEELTLAREWLNLPDAAPDPKPATVRAIVGADPAVKPAAMDPAIWANLGELDRLQVARFAAFLGSTGAPRVVTYGE